MSSEKEIDFENEYIPDNDNYKYIQGKGFFDFISDCATFAGIVYFILLLIGGAFGGYNLSKIFTNNDTLLIVFGFIGILAGFVLAVVTLSPIAILKQIREGLTDTNNNDDNIEIKKPDAAKHNSSKANINEDLNQYE